MLRAIVVGTDGSTRAGEAIRIAAGLAKACGASLHVVCAYKPLTSQAWMAGIPAEAGMSLGADLLRQLPDQAEEVKAHLDGVAGRLSRDDGVKVDCHCKAGNPADALLDVAAEVDADLIVVGNRGMTGARRVLGSVPNSVSHHATCAVMIVNTDEVADAEVS